MHAVHTHHTTHKGVNGCYCSCDRVRVMSTSSPAMLDATLPIVVVPGHRRASSAYLFRYIDLSGKFFFFVRKETSTLLVLLLVAALVVLPESNTRRSKPTTDNRKWTPTMASATARGRKCPGRAVPDRGPKKKPKCCVARRRKAAGSIKRPAGAVREVRSAVSERERRRHTADAR